MSWQTHPHPRREEEPETSQPKMEWQQRASRKLEAKFIHDSVWPALDDSARALIRSQCGPLASAPLTALPTSKATRLDPQLFRLLLCRRLHMPLPLSMRTCRCGRQLDMFHHDRAACVVAGVLGERGFPLECTAAQVCREAGARVSTNIPVWRWTWLPTTIWMDLSGGINLSQRLGEGTGSSGATHPSRKGPGRLPSSVEFPLGLQSGESFCSLFVGETACARHRRGRSSAGRCSERRQVLVTS